ncbi:MAG: hypothetical protein WAM66_12270 [Acidobacteriaceae bacterium]
MKLFSLSGCLMGCFLGLAFSHPAPILAQQSGTSPSSPGATPAALVLSKSLPSNGTLVLILNVGDLRVIPTPEANRLRLEIRGDASMEEERSWVKEFEVSGNRAKIEIHAPKDREHCVSCYASREITIYIPKHTAIKLDVGIGDVAIGGIMGDKQVRTGIGDLRIAVGDRKEYGQVDLSTRIGDINDSVYQSQPQGFLGKTETITREGQYHLRAHVGIGDLKLVPENSKASE